MFFIFSEELTPEEIYESMEWCLPGEEWKMIPGYEHYEASTFGRIRSIDHYTVRKGDSKATFFAGCIMKVRMTQTGYYAVCVTKDGDQRPRKVHRMVAETWIENVDNLPHINHKDENKLNNRVSNLEFCTPYYNVHYGTGIARCADANRKNYEGENRVVQYDIFGNVVREWCTANEAERALGITDIDNCISGRAWSSGGYVWKRKGQAFVYPGSKFFIVQLTLDNQLVAIHKNVKEAAKAVSMNPMSIHRALSERNGRTRHAIWLKYKDYEKIRKT